MYQTYAVEAFPQGADTAGVMHEHRYPLFFGSRHRLVTSLMRYLVCEDDNGIGMFDLAAHILLSLAENPQAHTLFFCLFQVLLS